MDDARGAGEALREPWVAMGGGGCKTAGAESTGCIVGCNCPLFKAWFGPGGGGYSGARWEAEVMRFLTLVRRPVEPEDASDWLSWSALEPFEKRDDSRWPERFPEIIVRREEHKRVVESEEAQYV